MAALAGKAGAIYVWDGNASTTFTDEACTNSGDNTTYYITDDTKRYWDDGTTVTVEVDAVPETAFTAVYAGGRITFDTPLTGTEAVTVSGKYYTMEQQGGFTNWSLDQSSNLADSTAFEGNGWKTFLPTIGEFSVSAERHWFNGEFLSRTSKCALALYIDYSNDYRFDCFAYLTSDSIECPTDDLVNESIEFAGEGVLSYNVA